MREKNHRAIIHWDLLCVRNHTEFVPCVNLFHLAHNPNKKLYFISQFTDEESEMQDGKGICLRTHTICRVIGPKLQF